MFAQGELTRDWYEERRRTLTDPVADQWGDRLIDLTSSYTFMGPLRFHLYKLARLRGEALGRTLDVDEAVLPLTHQFLGPPAGSPQGRPQRTQGGRNRPHPITSGRGTSRIWCFQYGQSWPPIDPQSSRAWPMPFDRSTSDSR